MMGRLKKVSFDFRGLATKRHYRDRRQVYFIGTDLSLAPYTALHWYPKRWSCEVDNLYLRECLGLGDFRLQPYESSDKLCTVAHLAYAYTQWRLAHATDRYARNLGMSYGDIETSTPATD